MTENKKIRFIYHCADLHIRLYKRHDEYREQFQKFFDSVKEHIEVNDLEREEVRIVIAGDVVHSKNQLTPELIDLVTWFFKLPMDALQILSAFRVANESAVLVAFILSVNSDAANWFAKYSFCFSNKCISSFDA